MEDNEIAVFCLEASEEVHENIDDAKYVQDFADGALIVSRWNA